MERQHLQPGQEQPLLWVALDHCLVAVDLLGLARRLEQQQEEGDFLRNLILIK
jgi:hypothetical protein